MAEYQKMREQKKEGGFEKWKREVSTGNKISFLLDHCNDEERARYIKEFSTAELAAYLKKHVGSLTDEQLNKLVGSKVSYHSLPILNTVWSYGANLRTAKKLSSVKEVRQASEVVVEEILKDKLKELEWRQLDKDIANDASVPQPKEVKEARQ
eukprot:CAMPEP_0202944940 /NCGR_PEP_ID=MMETSP1395-20130829/5877_1 /ASSEMBLY_ACC=CAM_ASM_000871 /TAXON_ID=5961 /ORGANISM="Blepharisma japonicum, Strain Stock R1072" /LENGTH=152 /DNA_ID=CAMNT_0049644385 /DNA_START=85 /DNA_END=543 /DNA_ORIENTATION=+